MTTFYTHTENDKISVDCVWDDNENNWEPLSITFESLLLKDMRGHPIHYTMIVDWGAPKQIIDLAYDIIERGLEC